MRYDIYAARLSPSAQVQEYAVEVRPPLADIAIEGLCKRLTTVSPRENDPPSAESVYVTRHDEVGTAFIVTPHASLRYDTEDMGETFRVHLDPCNLGDVVSEVHVVEGGYGLED